MPGFQSRRMSLWALLPICFFFGLTIGIRILYHLALSRGIVIPLSGKYSSKSLNGTPYPPFISITGAFPPMSSHFGQLMNMAAFLALLIGQLRFFQLRKCLVNSRLNYFSMVCFFIATLGLTMVGNYQVFRDKVIHLIGTVMTFGFGTGYCWMQVYFTMKTKVGSAGFTMVTVRFLLAVVVTVCYLLLPVFVLVSLADAARCQWVLVFMLSLYIGTFSVEFRYLNVEVVCNNHR